jgi:phosphoribosylformylglycinamidine synthase
MRVAVVQFPGSNCDRDCLRAFGGVLGHAAELVWHADATLPDDTRLVILPGGFSYGDYLRCGAIAALAPIMADVKRFAAAGGTVVGICNGFQILCEARMLPGVLLRNAGLDFVCKDVAVRIDSQQSRLTERVHLGRVLRLPIAHMEGNFTVDAETMALLEANGQIVLRYVDPATGQRIGSGANPNGAMADAAGVCNAAGNVVGLMPHPERAADATLGNEDGKVLLQALVEAVARA